MNAPIVYPLVDETFLTFITFGSHKFAFEAEKKTKAKQRIQLVSILLTSSQGKSSISTHPSHSAAD